MLKITAKNKLVNLLFEYIISDSGRGLHWRVSNPGEDSLSRWHTELSTIRFESIMVYSSHGTKLAEYTLAEILQLVSVENGHNGHFEMHNKMDWRVITSVGNWENFTVTELDYRKTAEELMELTLPSIAHETLCEIL